MIKWVGSPNKDFNRVTIDRIVIHWIVGTLASADAQFQKADPGTSAHYGVEDDVIHQYVEEEAVAYHAGNYPMNQRSIGIEHSAAPDRPASDATYETSGKLIADICKRHNISLDRQHILKHSEIKATQCPGTMDLDRLIKIAKQNNEPMAVITQKELDEIIKARNDHWDELQKLKETTISKEKYDIDIASRDNQIKERDIEIIKLGGELTNVQEKLQAIEVELENINGQISQKNEKIKNLEKELQNCKNSQSESGSATQPPESSIPTNQPQIDPFHELFIWLKKLFSK